MSLLICETEEQGVVISQESQARTTEFSPEPAAFPSTFVCPRVSHVKT